MLLMLCVVVCMCMCMCVYGQKKKRANKGEKQEEGARWGRLYFPPLFFFFNFF